MVTTGSLNDLNKVLSRMNVESDGSSEQKLRDKLTKTTESILFDGLDQAASGFELL